MGFSALNTHSEGGAAAVHFAQGRVVRFDSQSEDTWRFEVDSDRPVN
jgi:hypothetical protein